MPTTPSRFPAPRRRAAARSRSGPRAPSLSAKEHAHDADLGDDVLACAFAPLDEAAGPCRSPLQGLLAFARLG